MFLTGSNKAAGSENGQESAPGFLFALMEDLLSEPPESVAYLVEGMLPSGGVS